MIGVHLFEPPVMEIRRLYRFFGKTAAVHDVSFDVEKGSVFGFIGPNGAGKTTTMRILATLELPTYGDALVNGYSCINDPDVVRRKMGFMPDGFGTYPNMNCVEYLDFFARAYGLVGKDRVAAVRRTLSFTGLDKIAAKHIRGLSKGMRQRLCLGRAMVHDPTAIILDEPANGLDPRARIELRQMIQRLAAEGKSVLVSSHILTELAEMSDRVAIIEQGKLLAVGTVDEIQHGSKTHFDEEGNLVRPRKLSEITIRLVEASEQLETFLCSHQLIADLQLNGRECSFQWSGSEAEQAQLLRDIINQGIDVIEFRSKTKSLEEVFMQITTGAVQ